MNACIEHVEAAQAAEFSAARTVEAVTWARLEWWKTSEGTTVMAIAPADAATNTVTTFATLWH
jgi:hypothetical protein